jgi:hypothetical protein
LRFSIVPEQRTETASTPKLTELANHIATFEGSHVKGSRAQRNNNPGNLKYVTWSTRKTGLDKDGFAIYSRPEDGLADLHDFLSRRAEKGDTLAELIHIYAPPEDNNTLAYIRYISDKLGIDANSPLQ